MGNIRSIHVYYTDKCFSLENTLLVKFVQNYIRDSSDVFSISSLVKILMVWQMSLKLYLNFLFMIDTSPGLPRKSSEIFGKFRNFRQRSCNFRTSFGESSEMCGKQSEIFGKSSKTPSSVCLCHKKNITR